jgi:hypothetical protein
MADKKTDDKAADPAADKKAAASAYKLLAGIHVDANGTHEAGAIVYSDKDLVALHGSDKFAKSV